MEQWKDEIIKWGLAEKNKIYVFGEKSKFLLNGYDFYIFNYV